MVDNRRTGPAPRTLRSFQPTVAAPAFVRGYLLLIDRANPLSSIAAASTGGRC